MPEKHKEGELYGTVSLYGKSFNIYYGHYDDKDRQSRYDEPIPIYPDFVEVPEYTEDGYPFVTGIQDTCSHFSGKHAEDGCHGCKYYQAGDDLIGVCRCSKNKV